MHHWFLNNLQFSDVSSICCPLSPPTHSQPPEHALLTEPGAADSGKRKMDLWHSSSLHALQLVPQHTHDCVYKKVLAF